MSSQAVSFKLRSGGPQPRKGDCTTLGQAAPTTTFVLQTFLAEKSVSNICEDKAKLLCSTDMDGLGGAYVSASYTAQRFFDPTTNSLVFQATETLFPIYVDEFSVPGMTNL